MQRKENRQPYWKTLKICILQNENEVTDSGLFFFIFNHWILYKVFLRNELIFIWAKL